MKAVHYLLCLTALCAHAAVAQDVGAWEGAAGTLNANDKITLARADQTRSGLELSLKDFLVAFDGRMVNERLRVGLPLASLANKQLSLAYDLAGQNVMAQWHFAQTTLGGNRLDYKAYVGATGGVSMVLSTRY